MMSDLTRLTTPRRVGSLRFALDVPDGWQQGRGAFGGLVLASLVRAIEAEAGAPERLLRSLTATLCGPVLPGAAEILVEALRVGSGTSTYAARVVQSGEVQAHAVAVLGRNRASDVAWVDLPAPAMTPWREVPTLPPMPAGGAAFAQYFEFRNTGPLPLQAGPEARAAGWVRALDPGSARDAAWLVALADAWWPATIARLDRPRPIATIAFTFERVEPFDGLDRDAPLFHEGHTVSARDGFTVERRSLRGEDGRLLALNEQTIVIIR